MVMVKNVLFTSNIILIHSFYGRGCLLTSSIIATMSVGLTIPMSIMLRGISSQNKADQERIMLPSFYLGLVPITVSYFFIIWLTYQFNYNQNEYNCLDRCQRKNLIR